MPAGQLLHNLLLFGRLLRGLGLDVNPGRMRDLAQALDLIEIGRQEDFYHATRSLLIHDKADLPLFDQAFQLFWRRPERTWLGVDLPPLSRRPDAPRLKRSPPPLRRPANGTPDGGSPAGADDTAVILELSQSYSGRESLRHKEFGQLTPAELEAVKGLIAALSWSLGGRRSRRRRPGSGPSLDLRRSLRRSLRHGGELFDFAYRRPQLKPRPLVVIADISGSMERYTRLLLHFLYSLSKGLQQPVEIFLFSTRLTCVSRQLSENDVDRALGHVARAVPDWSGGTRIGEALKRFNYDWGRRVLGRGAVVLLISDGWDRGDPALLAAEMARLQRSCQRLIWLNPLLGSAGYQPLTRGMQAALPFVDDFLPARNLASLEDLARLLTSLEPRRRVRKQQRL
ncbi:MAG: vWA domain-containing protein [Candidatus Promineifilaceae bacterium]